MSETNEVRACIFCRNHDMADECWHSPEYESVARALAVAFTKESEPSEEQVGWYVDDAEGIGSDLWHYLGRDTPLTCRDLGYLDREPDKHAVLFNERLVVTLQSTEMGESMARVVADLANPTAALADHAAGDKMGEA